MWNFWLVRRKSRKLSSRTTVSFLDVDNCFENVLFACFYVSKLESFDDKSIFVGFSTDSNYPSMILEVSQIL